MLFKQAEFYRLQAALYADMLQERVLSDSDYLSPGDHGPMARTGGCCMTKLSGWVCHIPPTLMPIACAAIEPD
jgi:hypothetical protein